MAIDVASERSVPSGFSARLMRNWPPIWLAWPLAAWSASSPCRSRLLFRVSLAHVDPASTRAAAFPFRPIAISPSRWSSMRLCLFRLARPDRRRNQHGYRAADHLSHLPYAPTGAGRLADRFPVDPRAVGGADYLRVADHAVEAGRRVERPGLAWPSRWAGVACAELRRRRRLPRLCRHPVQRADALSGRCRVSIRSIWKRRGCSARDRCAPSSTSSCRSLRRPIATAFVMSLVLHRRLLCDAARARRAAKLDHRGRHQRNGAGRAEPTDGGGHLSAAAWSVMAVSSVSSA